jgi:hypothetical protein
MGKTALVLKKLECLKTARWSFLLVVVVTGAGLAGCSQPSASSQIAAMNDSNLRRVANLYSAFQMRNGFQGPKDEAEFKEFIQSMPPQKLEMMLVDPSSIDELFMSESSGEALEVVYGLKGSLGAQMAAVFELSDSDGKRRVAFTNGGVELIDDQQYKQLKEHPLRDGNTAGAQGG